MFEWSSWWYLSMVCASYIFIAHLSMGELYSYVVRLPPPTERQKTEHDSAWSCCLLASTPKNIDDGWKIWRNDPYHMIIYCLLSNHVKSLLRCITQFENKRRSHIIPECFYCQTSSKAVDDQRLEMDMMTTQSEASRKWNTKKPVPFQTIKIKWCVQYHSSACRSSQYLISSYHLINSILISSVSGMDFWCPLFQQLPETL